MSAVIALDYSDMNDTVKHLNKASDECGSYVKTIEKKVTKKVDDLKLGGNQNTSQVNYFARAKISALNKKKDKLSSLATQIKEARSYAQTTDSNVSKMIKADSKSFRSRNNMKVNAITEFFAWLSTTVLNSTAFGRFLNQLFKDVNTWIDGAKRKFKEWWELDGGKYIVKTVLAVVGTVVAVIFLVCVAWPALVTAIAALSGVAAAGLGAAIWTLITAAASFTTAVFAVVNGVTKIFANAAAIMSFNDDPGWAKRYNSYTSFAEYLRKNNFNNGFLNRLSVIVANGLDVLEMTAAVINIVDLCKNGISVLKSVKESGGFKAYYHKNFNVIRFRTKSGKVSFGTIKYGIKRVFSNLTQIKDLLINTTNISRIQDYHEKASKIYKFYKTLKSIEKIGKRVDNFADKGLWNTTGKATGEKYSTNYSYGKNISDLIKDLKAYIKAQKPAYSPSYATAAAGSGYTGGR